MKKADARNEAHAEHMQFIQALAHPVRLELLDIFSYRREFSPKEFGWHRGEPPSGLSHHFHMLEKLGRVELARTRPVRGAVEHIYRLIEQVEFSDQDWLEMSDEERRIVASATAYGLVLRLMWALQVGTLTARPDTHLSWLPLTLDELGWAEVTAILKRAFDEVKEADAKAVDRRSKSAQTGFSATVALASFESPPPPIFGWKS